MFLVPIQMKSVEKRDLDRTNKPLVLRYRFLAIVFFSSPRLPRQLYAEWVFRIQQSVVSVFEIVFSIDVLHEVFALASVVLRTIFVVHRVVS